jgi:hypothetical protein
MVRVTRSLVLYVCFVDHCLSFCTFSFRHCVVCSSSQIFDFFYLLHFHFLFKVNYSQRILLLKNGGNAELDFHSASSLKQQSAGRNVTSFGHIILIPSQPIFALSDTERRG